LATLTGLLGVDDEIHKKQMDDDWRATGRYWIAYGVQR
jgi:hypothetical protein